LKKAIAFFLSLGLIMALCACGREQEEGEQTAAPEAEQGFTNSFSYSEQSLPAPMTVSNCQYSDGDSLYFCGMDIAGKPLLIRTWRDDITGANESMEYKLPQEADYVFCCCKADRRLVVLAGDRPPYSRTGDLRTVSNEQDSYELFLLSFTEKGSLINTLPLSESPFDQGISVRSIVPSGESYYMLTQTQLIRADGEGHVMNVLTLDEGSFISQTLVEGKPLVCCFDGETLVLAEPGEAEDFKLRKIYTFESWQVQGMGTSADGRLLINDGGKIYSLDIQSGDTRTLFDFRQAAVGIDGYANVYPWLDGYLLSNHCQDQNVTLSPGMAEQRRELTLWTEYMIEEVLAYVRGFNQENENYYVTAVDIHDMSREQLMGKIAAGKGPDLYHVGDGVGSVLKEMDPRQIFMDLNPLMDESEILPQGSILPQLQRCMELDSKLYMMPVNFYFETVCTFRDSPFEPGLTLTQQEQQLREEESDYRLFTCFMDRDQIWDNLSVMYMNSHMEPERAACNFETPLFIELLEYCSEPEANFGGKSQGYMPCINYIGSLPGPLRLMYFQQQYGEELLMNTEFGSSYYLTACFAIGISSGETEGAMEFLSYANRRWPDNPRFTWPASTVVFQQLMEEYTSTGIYDEEYREYRQLSKNTEEQLNELLGSIKGIRGAHPALEKIMDEEAQRCFAGDISPEQAAAAIQSRAEIYLAEQYG